LKLLIVGAALAVALNSAALAQTPPPASAFGRQPSIYDAAISPNGQTIAILGGTPEVRTLSFAKIDQPDLPLLGLGDVEPVEVIWAGDQHAIVRIAKWDQVEAKASYRFERNLTVDTNAHVLAQLLQGDMASQALVRQPVFQITEGPTPQAIMPGVRVSSGPEGSMNTHLKRKGEERIFVPALMRVDPVTGKGVMVELGDFDTYGWDVDLSGEVRVRQDVDELTHKYALYGRAKGGSQWTPILPSQDISARAIYQGYSAPDDAVYLLREDGGLAQMTRRRLSDGDVQPIGAPARGSIALVWDHARATAVGLIPGGQGGVTEWLDPDLGAAAATLSKVFKGLNADPVSWSADRSRLLVGVSSGAIAPQWYLFDRTKKEISPLGESYPELKGVTFGPTRRLNYKARDGLDMLAYLTLPPGAKDAGAHLPLVVLPRGAPGGDDADDFDWLTQYVATRGYAVLRPQVRGAAGFGSAFERAGHGEWGGKVQTDLLDAIGAAAASGEIDPARVCIVGRGFGGYEALAGAALHPEAYRCAASIGGLVDIGQLNNQQVHGYGRDSVGLSAWLRAIGEASLAQVKATSPVDQAANIRAPILLIHGEHDTVSPPAQSKAMAEALKSVGRPAEYVVLPGADHYLMQSATRTQMLETLGAFLAKNLPVAP
jgi:dipeptidyl aminopeptidase/acylaminoacyl peptidase